MMSVNGQSSNAELDLVELPNGWTATTLDQILITLESGSRPRGGVRGIEAGVPSIGGEHLNDKGGFRFESIKFVPLEFYQSMNAGHIRNGDILIVKDGATTGKVSLVRPDFSYSPAVVNEHVFICRTSNEVLSSFVFYYLFSGQGQDRILQNFRGSAQGGINQGFTRGTLVPIAPVAEQKRIVAEIEELLAQVTAVRGPLVRVPKIMKRFRQAVLAAACSGKLTEDWRETHPDVESSNKLIQRLFGERALAKVISNEDLIEPHEIPDDWSWMRCHGLCDRNRIITYGVIKLGPPVTDGVPTLRSSDVRWLHIDDSNIKRISSKIASKYSRTFLKGGEVLVTVRGTLGGIAVVPDNMKGYNISREVAVVPVHPSISAKFVSLAIGSNWSQSWLNEVAKGVAYTGINIRDLKRLPIPMPPTEEQYEIVRRIEALFMLADIIEKCVESAKIRTDKLTQSILGKAFRGELVPTEAELARQEGRDYESASELLARIRERKEIAIPRVRRSKRNG